MNTEDTMHWAFIRVFEMYGLRASNEREDGSSTTITGIVDGNAVIYLDYKFENTQKDFIHWEITADKENPCLSMRVVLPCDIPLNNELEILRKINRVNLKLSNPGIFFNPETQLCEFKSYISFTGYHWDKNDDPDFEEDFRYCQDQAAINWTISGIDTALIWLQTE